MPALIAVRNGPYRGINAREVRRWAERMLRSLELGHAELSVALTDDEEIHELNHVFRQHDKPTDVLAFAMREGMSGPSRDGVEGDGPRAPELLGDVIVSVETARRQAQQKGRPLESEVRMLLAHGLLHLVGYDHQTKTEARVMGAKTRALCRAAIAAERARAARR